MAGQIELKKFAFSGHAQVSALIGNYLFAISESMDLPIGKVDKLRPVAEN